MDLMYSALIEVTQRTSTMNAEATTLTLPVPEDGNVHIKFKLQDQVEMLFIRASILIFCLECWPSRDSRFMVRKINSFSTVGLHKHLL